jgi:hypothetical protein
MLGTAIANSYLRHQAVVYLETQGRIMPMWPDRRLLDLFKIDYPILQAADGGSDGRRACYRSC